MFLLNKDVLNGILGGSNHFNTVVVIHVVVAAVVKVRAVAQWYGVGLLS